MKKVSILEMNKKAYRRTVVFLIEVLIVGTAFFGTLWIAGAVVEAIAHLLGV